MPLTDDIIRRLVATPYGRSQLDLILSANPGLAPNLSQGPEPAETGVPTRPRPLLTTPTMATAPTSGGFAADMGRYQMGGPPPADVMPQAEVTPGAAASSFTPESLLREPELAPADGGGMWDRVKDFFTPDDATDDVDPYDQDVSSRAWAGAAAAAAQTASDWRASPVQVLTNALSGYGTAKARAKEDLRTQAQQDRLFGLKERELEATISGQEGVAERAARDDARQQQQLDRLYAAGDQLPEGPLRDRFKMLIDIGETGAAAAMVNPDPVKFEKFGTEETGFFAFDPTDPTAPPIKLQEGTGPKPQQPFGSAESGYYQMIGGKAVKVVNGSPGAGREPPETWRTLSPEEVAARKLPEGTLAEVSSHGATRIPFKPTTQSSGITYTDTQGNSFQIGGSGPEGTQAVKLPQGHYMGDPSEEAKDRGITQKVVTPAMGTAEYAKGIGVIQASTKFYEKLKKIESIFAKYGTQVFPGEIAGELESLANGAKLDYANAKGQGALQKTDDAVITSTIGAVTDLKNLLPGGQAQVLAQLREAKASVDQDLDGLLIQYPWANVRAGGLPSQAATSAPVPAAASPAPVSVPTVPGGPPPAGVPTVDTPASILDEVGIQ